MPNRVGSSPSPLQANWLRAQGVKKGDCVAIYMPMICELPIAMVRHPHLTTALF